MERLENCPFCGGNWLSGVEAEEREGRPKCRWIARIYCFNCFAEIHTHGFEWTKEDAIKAATAAWNRRAYAEALAELARYREAEKSGELVRVVRCGECVENGFCSVRQCMMEEPTDDDYCSAGERREKE